MQVRLDVAVDIDEANTLPVTTLRLDRDAQCVFTRQSTSVVLDSLRVTIRAEDQPDLAVLLVDGNVVHPWYRSKLLAQAADRAVMEFVAQIVPPGMSTRQSRLAGK
jgi:hypothetical protein